MDCNCNQRSAGSCRPQMPPPPCMNTNCGCGSPMPMPPIQPRIGGQGGMMPDCGIRPSYDTQPPCAFTSSEGIRPSTYQRPMPPCKIEMENKPIAMAYVPWQQWRQTYPMDKALSRGTIFPELDLPFVMGRCR